MTPIIRYVQKLCFPQHFDNNRKDNASKQSCDRKILKAAPLFRLDSININGVLHVGGRLSLAKLSIGVRHPIILPQKSHITRLIIRDAY